MKRKKQAFTLIELMTVIGIIAILVGILLPSLAAVQKMAKNTKQKAQLTTIELALTAFKNDYGDYPPSSPRRDTQTGSYLMDYSGAQKLCEALMGWDLMGFHPDSQFRSDGKNDSGGWVYLNPDTFDPDDEDKDDQENLEKRKDPYLDRSNANVFRLGEITSTSPRKPGLFENTDMLEDDTFVICDVFGRVKITLGAGQSTQAGTPILYFKANVNSKDHIGSSHLNERIYSIYDNLYLLELGPLAYRGDKSNPKFEPHPLADDSGDYKKFYDFITDPKVPNPWPFRPDSYILISAGVDGQYGTADDITNF